MDFRAALLHIGATDRWIASDAPARRATGASVSLPPSKHRQPIS
jgi:hypothetical protein